MCVCVGRGGVEHFGISECIGGGGKISVPPVVGGTDIFWNYPLRDSDTSVY